MTNTAIKITYRDDNFYISNDSTNEKSFFDSAAYKAFLSELIEKIKSECNSDLWVHWSCVEDGKIVCGFRYYNNAWPWRPWMDDPRDFILLKDASGKYFEIEVDSYYFDDTDEIMDEDFVDMEKVENGADWQPDAEAKEFLAELQKSSIVDANHAMTFVKMSWSECDESIKKYIKKFNEYKDFTEEWLPLDTLSAR